MTSVAPPPPPPPAGGSAPLTTLSVTLTRSPLPVDKIPLDTVLKGLIQPGGKPGEFTLQSNLGNFSFKSNFPFPANTQAGFLFTAGKPLPDLQFTQLNGQNLTSANAGKPAGTLASSPPQTGGIAKATLININPNTTLKAHVVATFGQNNAATAPQTTGASTVSSPSAPLLNGQAAQPGNPNSVSLGSHPTNNGQTPPSQTGAKPATAQTTASGTSGGTVPSGGTPGGQATALLPLQTGNQLSVRLLSLTGPNQNTDTQATQGNVPKGPVLQGTVQGNSASNQPLIRTQNAFITLESTGPLQEGSKVRLELLDNNNRLSSGNSTGTTANKAEILAKSWPALEEAQTLLADPANGLANNPLNQIIPKPDNRLALNMIFFLKAIGRGSFKDWAGEQTLKAISKSKPGLAKELESDFETLKNDKAKSSQQDWRVTYVPMQNQDQIDQIRIAYKKAQNDDEQEKGDKNNGGVRFVIDVDLTKIGPLQLDGLAKEKDRNFNLIVRTHSALPAQMRKDINAIFTSSMQAVDYKGDIRFQVESRFIKIDGIEIQAKSLNLGMLV